MSYNGVSRRGFLQAAIGSATMISSTSAKAAAQESTTVDMTDNLVFDPEEIQISPGTTVTWENVGSIGHSVTAYEDEIPDEAEYFASGGFDSESAARNAYPDEGNIPGGETYEYTFETEGEYGYFCIPHEQAGMVGTVIVGEGGGGDGASDGGPSVTIPDRAITLTIAAITAMGSVLGFAYFVLKYGGDYEGFDE